MNEKELFSQPALADDGSCSPDQFTRCLVPSIYLLMHQVYFYPYGLENVDSKHANPFDQPTNQTSSLSSTFSVKGSCSENADFAFAEFEFESTLVTEWNWVISKYKITVKVFVTAQYCRTPQTSYVQLFYIFGLFVGSFLLGRVADRCSQYAFKHVVLSPMMI